MNSQTPPGLYVHVPFCASKCIYCDFYSETDLRLIPAWMEGLAREKDIYRDLFPVFDTLYFGGGTPTVLSAEQLERLVMMLFRSFRFAGGTEITVEANPDDVTDEKLAILKACGVNRISLGVQSFTARDLVLLKRRHTVGKAIRALELIRAHDFNSLGIDLIYAIPGQTEEEWRETLAQAVTFEPEHLSCYQLTAAEETALCAMQKRGRIRMPAETEGERLFLAAAQYLEQAGYVHYEISNYARGEGNLSRHNQKYWQHAPYLGLGPAAHSFWKDRRWWNCRSIADYCRVLEQGGTPVSGEEILTPEQLELETLYLGLRTRRGIDAALLFSSSKRRMLFGEMLRADYVKHDGQRVVPTTKGFLVADRLAAALS